MKKWFNKFKISISMLYGAVIDNFRDGLTVKSDAFIHKKITEDDI